MIPGIDCDSSDASNFADYFKDPQLSELLEKIWPRFNQEERIWCPLVPEQYIQKDWVKLIDGRLVSVENIIFPNCTGVEIKDDRPNTYYDVYNPNKDYDGPTEIFEELDPYFDESLRSNKDLSENLASGKWIQYPDGTIVAQKAGLILYPSGVLTTLDHYVFPEIFY